MKQKLLYSLVSTKHIFKPNDEYRGYDLNTIDVSKMQDNTILVY